MVGVYSYIIFSSIKVLANENSLKICIIKDTDYKIFQTVILNFSSLCTVQWLFLPPSFPIKKDTYPTLAHCSCQRGCHDFQQFPERGSWTIKKIFGHLVHRFFLFLFSHLQWKACFFCLKINGCWMDGSFFKVTWEFILQ